MGSFFFLTLQKSLVRTIIEYTFPVSNPNFVRDIFLLEQVQKKVSRLALDQRRGETSYENRCVVLAWLPLT